MVDRLVARLPTSKRMLLVAIGDTTAIAAFAATGALSHGGPILSAGDTFLSFAVGWFVVAVLTDVYGKTALSSLGRAAGLTAITWFLAVLLGGVIRIAVVEGATLAPTFLLASIVFGGGFLVVWRVFAALVFS